ncbi:MAG: hypothetical protein CMD91_04195 [Gammaproteobacteria bacterium]|nr:hypothetical protein [Gammaproteobacteria bacterium]
MPQEFESINDNINSIHGSETLLDLLLEWEDVLDSLDIYAFKNWKKGELVDGPQIEKYWITCTIMYPYKLMPDPDATKRLTKHGIKVSYKEDHYLKPAKLVHPEDSETRANEEPFTDEGQKKRSEGKRRAKLIKIPTWLVKIEIPRHFIDEFLADTAGTSGDDDIKLEDVKDAYDEGAGGEEQYQDTPDPNMAAQTPMPMESVVREGLEPNDLRDIIDNVIAIDTFQPKLGAEEETIVTTFKVLKYEPPAQDLAHFIEQGQYDILDAEVSPGSDEDGNYLVFVEIKRDKNYFMKIQNILKDVKNITNVDEWKFSSFRHSLPKDFNRDNIEANVTLDKTKYKAIFMNPTITQEPVVEPATESIKKRIKFLVNY